jgi:hypothetical protein
MLRLVEAFIGFFSRIFKAFELALVIDCRSASSLVKRKEFRFEACSATTQEFPEPREKIGESAAAAGEEKRPTLSLWREIAAVGYHVNCLE